MILNAIFGILLALVGVGLLFLCKGYPGDRRDPGQHCGNCRHCDEIDSMGICRSCNAKYPETPGWEATR